MRRRRAGLVLVLLATLTVAGLLPAASAQGEGPVAGGTFVLPATGPEPTELGRELGFVPLNASFDVELRFQAREPVDDVLEIRVRDGTANRTRVPVNASAGETVAVPFSVEGIRAAQGGEAGIEAAFRNLTHRGEPVVLGTQLTVIPQPRARLVSPPNHPSDEDELRVPVDGREGNRLVADWDEEVPIRARLENPWGVPTGPLPVQARHRDRVVAQTEVTSLAPGEARVVTVGTVTHEEVDRTGVRVASRVRDPGSVGSVALSVGRDGGNGGTAEAPEPDGWGPLYNYTWPGPSLHGQQRARGAVEFRRGVAIVEATANLTLGEPSRVTVEVRHHGGGPARRAAVDLHVHPFPDLAYGVDSTTRRSVTAQLEPRESRFLNVTLTPRVGAPHQVRASVTVGGDETRSRQRVPLETPVDLRIAGETTRKLTKGETVEATVAVQAPEGLDGQLGWAATVDEARYADRGTPFSSLVTKDDLAEVSYARESVTGAGATATNVTLEARGIVAGDVAVVPTLQADGLVYPGAAGVRRLDQVFDRGAVVDEPVDGRRRPQVTGVLGLRVQPTGSPVPAAFAPPALLLLGLAGVEVHRRWYVR